MCFVCFVCLCAWLCLAWLGFALLCLPACLLACLPACLPACVRACWLACLLVMFPCWFLGRRVVGCRICSDLRLGGLHRLALGIAGLAALHVACRNSAAITWHWALRPDSAATCHQKGCDVLWSFEAYTNEKSHCKKKAMPAGWKYEARTVVDLANCSSAGWCRVRSESFDKQRHMSVMSK